MGINRRHHRRRYNRFGQAGGKHTVNKKIIYQHKHTYGSKLNHFGKFNVKVHQNTGNRTRLIRSILHKYSISKKRAECVHRLLFQKHPTSFFNIKRVSSDKPFAFKINRVTSNSYDGYRLMNLQLLQQHIDAITIHVANCDKVCKIVANDKKVSPVKLTSEVRTLGLASVIEAKCQGCNERFRLDTSPQIHNGQTYHHDVNVRAVWGSMVTGGGAAHLNECMATLEQEIGDLWYLSVKDDLLAAGAEERRLAIEKGNYHNGIPCITVICDGGWSKRSHKHSYNALGGVAVIIGAETGKLLHIGVRNKHCYICSHSEANHTQPRPHECYKNWSESSQAMESSIIVEGFQQAEKTHGLRYTTVIADGDSSVYAKIQEQVPIWGKDVKKLECANHVCKCLRSSLEKLVDQNPMYKGKQRLTKALRVRITTAVRCAIRVRSKESNQKNAAKQLDHDIRNSIYHILGNHDRCSDFCKAREVKISSKSKNDSNGDLTSDNNVDLSSDNNENTCTHDLNSVPNIIDELSSFWTEGTSLREQEESRGKSTFNSCDIDSMMIKDINILFDRVASKSTRLLGNFNNKLGRIVDGY
ncbi:uncharacterized protein LOC117319268 [Pecten maximus]|uniref:uncharacterized protein LOC117319268 n=1 Tax=Pecten maximus TaxID=6579 RepID=UPI001458EFFF|nr:uncharacterized protein LOC117319268 [Pecten maximus]